MTNQQIEIRLGELVREERRITSEILTLIREAHARKLYLERGYPNLYEWLVRGYGYSHAAAYRRIQAAHLVSDLPEVAKKLEAGQINLTTGAQLQAALNKEERRTGEKVDSERKAELVGKIEGKTSEATEAILAQEFPDVSEIKARLRILNRHEAKLTLILAKEAVEALERAQELLSHALPGASLADVVAHLAKDFVKKRDPLAKSIKPAEGKAEVKSAPDKRRVNASLRREIFRRAHAACEYQNPETGKLCGSRQQVEVDHRLPKALGGTDRLENLRCLCRKHNQFEAERMMGAEFMERKRA